ncbi:MAG TPA: hypothetical protein VL285_14860 [Bryobacteraceae bacterium]|nr:hypothetical protein [Bryobacteraceae bacterium]
MRVSLFLTLGGLAAACLAAPGGKTAAIIDGTRPQVSMWIWSDKYVYQAGQSLTLRWTVKTHGDEYPYTVFVYRQNNQTGRKWYFPGGEEPTDMSGGTLAAGFQPAPLTSLTGSVLIGAGGKFPALTIPPEPGMHTIAVQLRDKTGTHVLKSSYMKIGVVKEAVTLSGEITADRTLTNDTEWDIKGIVYVKNNATLAIEPGTFVIGQPGTTPPSALIITQNGKIAANGTKSRPIVMTSSLPFGQRSRGDWGGLVMLGKAPINVGGNITTGATCAGSAEGCKNAPGTFYIEGLVGNADSVYGGADPNHNCGSLKYVRVEYAGTILSPDNELNSFTWGGCGKGTTAEHLQAIYGKDDCFEWFGGTMDAKYLVGGLCADDFTDYQLGYTGRVQYGLMYQSPDQPGNKGVEGDNSEYDAAATPYSNPTFFNITYLGPGVPAWDEASNSPGIFVRRGSRGSFNNIVVQNFYSPCMDINDTATQSQADAGNLTMNGVLCWNNNTGAKGANDMAGQIPAAYNLAYARGQKGNGAGKNFVVADPLIARPFEYSDPDFAGLFGSPLYRAGWIAPPDDGFFDQSAQFLGGIGEEDWTAEWTNFLVETDIQ